MKILLNVSGGIDSSALLKKYVYDTDYEIVAHKIQYGGGQRQIKETEALDSFVSKLQTVRDFEYIKSRINYATMPIKTLDVPNLAMLTIPVAQSKKVDEVYFGFVSDKEGQDERLSRMLKKFNGWYFDLADMNSWETKRYYDTIMPLFAISEFHNTKKEYIKILGEDIYSTWFCRGDKTKEFKWDKPCGSCHTCNHVINSLEQILKEQ